MFSKGLENNVGKGEIACYEQFLLFPYCFKNTCTLKYVKTKTCLGKGSRFSIQSECHAV